MNRKEVDSCELDVGSIVLLHHSHNHNLRWTFCNVFGCPWDAFRNVCVFPEVCYAMVFVLCSQTDFARVSLCIQMSFLGVCFGQVSLGVFVYVRG